MCSYQSSKNAAVLLFLLVFSVIPSFATGYSHTRFLTYVNSVKSRYEKSDNLICPKSIGLTTYSNRSWKYYGPSKPHRSNKNSKNPIQIFMRKYIGSEITATKMLIGMNIIVYIFTNGVPLLSSVHPAFAGSQKLLRKLMKLDVSIARGEKYRLLTSLFCHAGLYHVGVNSYSLAQIGPVVEKAFGSVRFVTAYLAAGILANYVTYVMGTSPASLGASGCTFGLMGAFATHLYRNKRILGSEADVGLSSIKQTVMVNLLYGSMMRGIDQGAHIGGFISGGIFSFLFGPRLMRIRNQYGGSKTVDRPLLNYIKYWKTTKKMISFNDDTD